MKTLFIDSFAEEGNFKIGEQPKPMPQENEVLIAVAYAGVNPADAKIAKGLFQSRMPHQFPLILGWEASGVVESCGSKVSGLQKGDRVFTYCRKPTLQWGAFAEYVAVQADHVAPIPECLSMEEAAAIPLAGLTAWQALFEKALLKAGEQVLIHGGGGGVGGYAIQWAKSCGAYVITTASKKGADYVLSLGADEVIDYQTQDFAKVIREKYPLGIDVVFDTVGKAVYQKSFEVLKRNGRIVSLLEQPNVDLAKTFGVQAEYLFVSPNGSELKKIGDLFKEKRAIPPQIQIFPFDEAIKALEAIQKGNTKGKIVIKIA